MAIQRRGWRTIAATIVDDLILREVDSLAHRQRLAAAADALALLSDSRAGRPESIAAARAVYVPLAQQRIAANQWAEAANAIGVARRIGVDDSDLETLAAAIREAGLDRATTAMRQSSTRERLRLRLEAEAILVAAERAADTWGTPPLIELRTSMAHDIAALERNGRRGPSS